MTSTAADDCRIHNLVFTWIYKCMSCTIIYIKILETIMSVNIFLCRTFIKQEVQINTTDKNWKCILFLAHCTKKETFFWSSNTVKKYNITSPEKTTILKSVTITSKFSQDK